MQIAVTQPISLSIEPGLSLEDWRELGSAIAAQHRNISWLAGDYYNYGVANYGEQAILDLPEFGNGAAKLREVAKVAAVFSQAERDASLSFDHYKHLASLPHGEAQKLLARAKADKLLPSAIRTEAIKRKAELGQGDFVEDDFEYQERTRLVRLWNNSSLAAREDFFALADDVAGNGFGRIDG